MESGSEGVGASVGIGVRGEAQNILTQLMHGTLEDCRVITVVGVLGKLGIEESGDQRTFEITHNP